MSSFISCSGAIVLSALVLACPTSFRSVSLWSSPTSSQRCRRDTQLGLVDLKNTGSGPLPQSLSLGVIAQSDGHQPVFALGDLSERPAQAWGGESARGIKSVTAMEDHTFSRKDLLISRFVSLHHPLS